MIEIVHFNRLLFTDFEITIHNVIRLIFFRHKYTALSFPSWSGMATQNSKAWAQQRIQNRQCEIGKWSTFFFGLPFLDCNAVEDCFVEDLMSDLPIALTISDVLLIFVFLDAIPNIQITTYIMMTLNIPEVVRRSEMDKLTYLMDQYCKLQSDEKDHCHFIKAIGYKYSAVANP